MLKSQVLHLRELMQSSLSRHAVRHLSPSFPYPHSSPRRRTAARPQKRCAAESVKASTVDLDQIVGGESEDCELPWWSRTYCGYQERFVQPFELPLGGDRALTLTQAPRISAAHSAEASGSSDGGATTGATVWDAGIVLAAHLLQRPRGAGGAGGVCLDLGSGTGIVGLAAAASGAFSRVLLSDMPSVVPLLSDNLQRNADVLPRGGAPVHAVALRWDDAAQLERVRAMGPFELIVGGDILYREQVVQPLMMAVGALATERTTVLLSASLQHSPSTIRAFAVAATEAGFEVRALETSAQHADWTSPEVRLLQLRRRTGATRTLAYWSDN